MLLKIDTGILYFTGSLAVNVPRPLEINEGVIALTGPNGSGKTTLARIIERGWNFRTNRISAPGNVKPSIKHLEFSDIYSWTGLSVGHYQQRYEAAMNDEVPSVCDVMGDKTNLPEFRHYCSLLNLKDVENKKINFLSSGELRKLLVINALLDMPDLLILDNPYIGLDTASRKHLNEALATLATEGQSFMLLLSDSNDVPSFTTGRIHMDSMTVVSSSGPESIDENADLTADMPDFPFSSEEEPSAGTNIVEMNGCSVSYGSVTVFNNIYWTIKAGERWSLTGPNGSGKSTLLSLIFADNPKAYSAPMSLFGRKRGTGESIWDIKKHIGYISPEMQLHFHGSGSVRTIIAQGLNDTVGLFLKPKDYQLTKADRWLNHFGIEHLADRTFDTLSSGERQLVLIARTMIKEPRLLILDEPMHALDSHNRKLVTRTIEDLLEIRPSTAFIMVTHNPSELPPVITHHFQLHKNAP